jgi:hypothetical protein
MVKQATRLIGSFAYLLWMRDMIPLLYRNGNQYLHRKSSDYRSHVKRKIHAYHVFIQAGVIAQGLLQYLAVVSPKLVWDSFGYWLRTIRPGVPPSELVVANALLGKTKGICAYSAWLHEHKEALLRSFVTVSGTFWGAELEGGCTQAESIHIRIQPEESIRRGGSRFC